MSRKPIETGNNSTDGTNDERKETEMTDSTDIKTQDEMTHIDGLDTVSTALGFVTVPKSESPRFDIDLVNQADGSVETWLKFRPIRTRDDGFGLYGFNHYKTWLVSADGKKSDGFIMLDEKNRAYTQSPYAITDKQNFIYRSIANMVNRAAGRAVDPGMTQKEANAALVANISKERDDAAREKETSKHAGRILAAMMMKETEGITRDDVATARKHETWEIIPDVMIDAYVATLTN